MLAFLSEHMFTVIFGLLLMSAHRNAALQLSPLRKLLRHPLWAPFNHIETWDRLSTSIHPLWSITEVRAKVVAVVDEAPNVKSILLKPNARFKGFKPGQHVMLELEVNGARHARCFSFSDAPRADGLLRLTIKSKLDGAVSNAALALTPGKIVRLSQAQGGFSPRGSTGKLLMISAGSGITPMMSLLQAINNQNFTRDVALIHCSSSETDTIFANELKALSVKFPQFKLHLHHSTLQARLNDQHIKLLVPDWHEREALLCGPDSFMQMIEAMYAEAQLSALLQSESFGRRAAPINPNALQHQISTQNTEQVFTVLAGQSVLDGAEAAGLTPRFGCRRGICRTCQCLKRSGTVKNLLTGQVSGPGEELIQLCISTPQSALELAL
jgi:stearoyl-CoA 9-desaturase NADPH oxidoreductase